MDAQTTIILAICGVLGVVGLVMVLGALLMYRMLRFNVVNALMGWFMRGDDSTTHEEPISAQTSRRRADDLRARAEALDFDKAVQQYQRKQPDNVTITGSPQVAPSPEIEERPINTSSPIDGRSHRVTKNDAPGGFSELPAPNNTRPLRKRRRDPNPDEIFGGMLDDDGDGSVDF
jgi:hypothetical protein